MPEDRFEQEEPKDEDVEAHKRRAVANDEPRTEESGDSDDVEAHRKHAANEEPGSDDSDDFEAHRKHN